MLFSHVKISSFLAKAHLLFHWCLHNNRFYVSDVCIIKQDLQLSHQYVKIVQVPVCLKFSQKRIQPGEFPRLFLLVKNLIPKAFCYVKSCSG